MEDKTKAAIELKPCPFCGNAPTRRNGIQLAADVPKDYAYCSTETCPISRFPIYLDEWNARQECDRETADLRDRLADAKVTLQSIADCMMLSSTASESCDICKRQVLSTLTRIQETK
jgi:hypothetical protein